MSNIYPSFIPYFKHKYNTDFEGFQKIATVNSLCQYVDINDFTSFVEPNQELEINKSIIPRLFDLGAIIINNKSYYLGDEQSFFTNFEFSDSISIDNTFTSFLSNPKNLLLLYSVTYDRRLSVFKVACHYVENYKEIDSPFLKEYIRGKRKYLINKITNTDV